MKRGDVVIVDLRPQNPQSKVRPAIVVQNDRDNARMTNTVVVQVTSNLQRAAETTQVLIDKSHPDWLASGLLIASVANCSTIYTVDQRLVRRVLGSLSKATMNQIDSALRAALGLA